VSQLEMLTLDAPARQSMLFILVAFDVFQPEPVLLNMPLMFVTRDTSQPGISLLNALVCMNMLPIHLS
jgi:hypothetical protein